MPIRYTNTDNAAYPSRNEYRIDAAPHGVHPRHLKIDLKAPIEENIARVRSDMRKGKDRTAEVLVLLKTLRPDV